MTMLQTRHPTEGEIWNRLLKPGAKTLSAQAAKFLVGLEFAQEDKDRMRDLAAKAREGTLTPSEQEEARSYEHVGNLLALLKSKARKRLKEAGHAHGSRH